VREKKRKWKKDQLSATALQPNFQEETAPEEGGIAKGGELWKKGKKRKGRSVRYPFVGRSINPYKLIGQSTC